MKRLAEAAPNWTPSAAAGPWPEIGPFDELDLPDFPTHALPDVLRRWVEAESHATQTPADLAGLLALAVCSAALPGGWWWNHAPVGASRSTCWPYLTGNRKSAVFADAMRPLRELEARVDRSARPAVAREQSDRRQAEARLRKLEKAGGRERATPKPGTKPATWRRNWPSKPSRYCPG